MSHSVSSAAGSAAVVVVFVVVVVPLVAAVVFALAVNKTTVVTVEHLKSKLQISQKL